MRPTAAILSLLLSVLCSSAPGQVRFSARGVAVIEGEPFFPIGVYTYGVDDRILTELRQMGFNTVVAGFQPEQLSLIEKAGMKAICVNGPEWRAAAKHPAVLGWYLMDEPESGKTVAEVLAAYRQLKDADPAHPIGLVHSMFEAISIFRDCADFTMPDIYPVTAKRDAPLSTVARYVDESRRVHGEGWPCWPFIQAFGGTATDDGKWALPTPDEVRCMTFLALAHHATGILYFSYWPQGGETWRSLSDLNRDVNQIVPWLIADGSEGEATSSQEAVHLRVRWVQGKCILIAVNSTRDAVVAKLRVKGVGETELHVKGTRVRPVAGAWEESFDPLQVKILSSEPLSSGPGGRSG